MALTFLVLVVSFVGAASVGDPATVGGLLAGAVVVLVLGTLYLAWLAGRRRAALLERREKGQWLDGILAFATGAVVIRLQGGCGRSLDVALDPQQVKGAHVRTGRTGQATAPDLPRSGNAWRWCGLVALGDAVHASAVTILGLGAVLDVRHVDGQGHENVVSMPALALEGGEAMAEAAAAWIERACRRRESVPHIEDV